MRTFFKEKQKIPYIQPNQSMANSTCHVKTKTIIRQTYVSKIQYRKRMTVKRIKDFSFSINSTIFCCFDHVSNRVLQKAAHVFTKHVIITIMVKILLFNELTIKVQERFIFMYMYYFEGSPY